MSNEILRVILNEVKDLDLEFLRYAQDRLVPLILHLIDKVSRKKRRLSFREISLIRSSEVPLQHLRFCERPMLQAGSPTHFNTNRARVGQGAR